MTQTQKIEKQATEFLRTHGYGPNAEPKGKKSESIKALATPCGGQPGWRRKKR